MLTNTIKTLAFLPILLSTYFLKPHRQADFTKSPHNHCGNFIHVARLPVRFNSFNLIKDLETVLANWQTVEDQNNKHDVVNWSDNGHTYLPIATIPYNNGTDLSNSFWDKAPLYGKSFYHISQVEKNGMEIFSSVRTSSCMLHPATVLRTTQ